VSRVEIHRLIKEWGKIRAVDDVSFQVAEGSLTVLLGPFKTSFISFLASFTFQRETP